MHFLHIMSVRDRFGNSFCITHKNHLYCNYPKPTGNGGMHMKKNLISVLILALCFANLVLTALLIFTIILCVYFRLNNFHSTLYL